MRLADPWMLALLALVPLVLWRSWAASQAVAAGYSSLSLVSGVRPTLRARTRPSLVLLRGACMSLVIFALARPQFGVGRVESTVQAVAIQVVVDRSGSMNQPMEFQGSTMSRLDVVKRVLGEFLLGNGRELKGRKQDLVGMVAFATRAETVCPPVRDPKAVVELAKTLEPARTRAEGMTAIGDGLALAAARLAHLEDDLKSRLKGKENEHLKIKSKLIILLTDGRQNAGDMEAADAAKLAAKWGIKVYTIGIGGDLTVDTPFGRQVIQGASGVDEATLKQVADKTGGIYQRATDGEALRRVYDQIDKMEKSSVATVQFTDYDERFTPWLAAAGACLLTEMLLGATLYRRIP